MNANVILVICFVVIAFNTFDGADAAVVGTSPPSTDTIFVGGQFTSIGVVRANSFSTSMTASRVAMYTNGNWQSLGPVGAEGTDGTVSAISVRNGQVLVGGSFQNAGGVATGHLAQYNPVTSLWTSFANGAGLAASGGFVGPTDQVLALFQTLSYTFIGGSFSITKSDGTVCTNFVLYDHSSNPTDPASRWICPRKGFNSNVSSIAGFGSNVIIVGSFTNSQDGTSAGLTRTALVGLNDSGSWDYVQVTSHGNDPAYSVNSVSYCGGNWFIGGNFPGLVLTTPADGTLPWMPFGRGLDSAISASTGAPTNYANTVSCQSGSTVYVGGNFLAGGLGLSLPLTYAAAISTSFGSQFFQVGQTGGFADSVNSIASGVSNIYFVGNNIMDGQYYRVAQLVPSTNTVTAVTSNIFNGSFNNVYVYSSASGMSAAVIISLVATLLAIFF